MVKNSLIILDKFGRSNQMKKKGTCRCKIEASSPRGNYNIEA